MYPVLFLFKVYRCRWRTVFQAILAVCTGVLHLTQQWTCRLFKGKTNGHRMDDGFSLNGHSAFIVVFNKTSKNSYTCTRLVSGCSSTWHCSLIFGFIWYDISDAPKSKNAQKLIYTHYGLWQVCLNVCRLHQLILTRSLLEQMSL